MKSEPFVSVVTPVYNGAKYLEECIQSVLRQTYSNWEYIIVNNLSKDNTLQIANKYASLDSRIKVTTNDIFLPVMKNFNHAISKISEASIYTKIICADDWLYPEYLTNTIYLAERNPTVGIVSSYRLREGKIFPQKAPDPYKNVFSGLETGKMNFLNGPYTFGSPTCLLYRSSIVRQKRPFYNEERTSGDTEVCYEILKNWDFGFVHQILSFNRTHERSVTSKNSYFGSNTPDHLYMLQKHGKHYLNNREYTKRKNELIQAYFKFLAKHIFRFNDIRFKNYHRKNIRSLNIKHFHAKIIKYFFIVHFGNIIDFKSHLKIVSNYFKFNS